MKQQKVTICDVRAVVDQDIEMIWDSNGCPASDGGEWSEIGYPDHIFARVGETIRAKLKNGTEILFILPDLT